MLLRSERTILTFQGKGSSVNFFPFQALWVCWSLRHCGQALWPRWRALHRNPWRGRTDLTQHVPYVNSQGAALLGIPTKCDQGTLCCLFQQRPGVGGQSSSLRTCWLGLFRRMAFWAAMLLRVSGHAVLRAWFLLVLRKLLM